MGILYGIARLLIEEHQRKPFKGRVLQLGRQEVMIKRSRLNGLIAEMGLTPLGPNPRSAADPEHVSDEEFFGVFQPDAIDALDATADIAATVVHDLNNGEVAAEHRGKYDLIFDGGTMEHVFHAPNMLHAIHELLAPGGRIIHNTPASNAVDHGFYSFSPCFYFEYYSSNGYELNTIYLIDYGTRLRPIRMTAYNYLPPLPRSALDGRLVGNVHYNYVVATKLPAATAGKVPQQSFYQAIWDEAAGSKAGSEGTRARPPSLTSRVKGLVKSNPALNKMIRSYGLPAIRLMDTQAARKFLRTKGRQL